MYVQKRIEEALHNFKSFTQGNCCGIITPGPANDEKTIDIYYYGSKIFTYNSKTKKAKYDFCGYEGYSLTTHLINHCLRMVNSPYIISCAKGKVREVSNKEYTKSK